MKSVLSHRQAARTLRPLFCFEVEEVGVLALDTQLKILGAKLLFRGTLDQCLFHPRDLFRFLVQHNASRFILAHTHPSGNLVPSLEDQVWTDRVVQLGEMIQISCIDHLILTKSKSKSLMRRP